MEILGRAGESFIVKVGAYELANIAGKDYPINARLDTGTKINVDAAWRDLRAFRNAAKNINEAAESLRACATLAEKTAVDYVIEPEEETPTA